MYLVKSIVICAFRRIQRAVYLDNCVLKRIVSARKCENYLAQEIAQNKQDNTIIEEEVEAIMKSYN